MIYLILVYQRYLCDLVIYTLKVKWSLNQGGTREWEISVLKFTMS